VRNGHAPAIRWAKPAALWPDTTLAFDQPWLVELEGDRFLPDFLDLVGGKLPGQTPADLGQKAPAATVGGAYKLFQPLHARYYLVTGSLVCRQLGFPDRRVARQDGESTSFVLRRRRGRSANEEGWVEDGANRGWQAASADALLDGEERFPLHSASVCISPPLLPAAQAALARPECRAIYYGYVSVASREQYLTPVADPVATLASVPPPPAGSGLTGEPDPRLSELEARVLRPWRALYIDPITGSAYPAGSADRNLTADQLQQASLFLLLDLGDYLQRTLPDVYQAALSATGTVQGTGKTALLAALRDVRVNNDSLSLAAALAQLQPYAPLVRGEPLAVGVNPDPGSFDVREAFRTDPAASPARISLGRPSNTNASSAPFLAASQIGDTLYHLIRDAIQEGATAVQVPDELQGLIKADPPADDPNADTYVIRLVYEHPPCQPVLSEPSAPFVFAKALDPDAPARKVRIELPSIKDLRKFKRGVAMETPPDLRSLMDRVNKGMLDGGGLSAGAEWQLGMICSFSIQIITMVAFIVLFIFLIAFNFIFWWLAFLRICFPIPVKK